MAEDRLELTRSEEEEELDIRIRSSGNKYRIGSFMLRLQMRAIALCWRTNGLVQDGQPPAMLGQQRPIELVESSTSNKERRLENGVQSVGSQWPVPRKNNNPGFIRNLIMRLYVWYLALKLLLLALLQYRHDSLLPKLKVALTEIRPINSSIATCFETIPLGKTEWDELGIVDKGKFNQLIGQFKQCLYWMDLLGNPMVSCTGSTIVLLSCFAALPIIFLSFGLKKPTYQLDRMAFYLDPIRARRTFKNELSRLIEALISTARDASLCVTSNMDLWNYSRAQFNKTQASVRVLLDIGRSGKLEPVNLSAGWFKSVCNHHLSDSGQIVFSLWLTAMMVSSSVAYELIGRVEFRIAGLRCREWLDKAQPTNISLPNNYQIYQFHPQPVMSEAHEQAYLDHDGSWSSLAALTLFIEFPYYLLKPNVFLTLIEISLLLSYDILISVFGVNLYLHSCLDKIVWLRQIERQINESINLLAKGAYSCEDLMLGQPEEHKPRYYSFHQLAELHSRDQTETLALAYLNMEMFRKRQHQFRDLLNSVIAQYSALTLVVSCVVYLVGKSVQNTPVLLILMLPSILMLFANIMLVVGATLTRSLEWLARDLIRLAAFQGAAGRHADHLLELWRRQVLDDDDMLELNALSVFGLPLTAENILLANAYFIGLWPSRWKPQLMNGQERHERMQTGESQRD